ncbi:MAG: biotin--[Clostridia bacterium]|nr:biotin--[acetyl-CoA-carboxylase] ligase [Clostridia bacterium]
MDLCLTGVLSELKNKKFYNIEVIDKVTSTNDILKEKAKKGASEGVTLIALSQSAGRGRLGRKFYSEDESGLYFSIILRPDLNPEDAVLITTAASVAVARAIEDISDKKADIKWVNDVYLNGKKVCGILVESGLSAKDKKLDYAVLGIGINVFEPKCGFNDEIKDIAGAVFDSFDFGIRNRLCAKILDNFCEIYKNLSKKEFVSEYICRSCVVGKDIKIIESGTEKDAFCTGIDENCKLEVKYQDGTKRVLSFGEISIKIGH